MENFVCEINLINSLLKELEKDVSCYTLSYDTMSKKLKIHLLESKDFYKLCKQFNISTWSVDSLGYLSHYKFAVTYNNVEYFCLIEKGDK